MIFAISRTASCLSISPVYVTSRKASSLCHIRNISQPVSRATYSSASAASPKLYHTQHGSHTPSHPAQAYTSFTTSTSPSLAHGLSIHNIASHLKINLSQFSQYCAEMLINRVLCLCHARYTRRCELFPCMNPVLCFVLFLCMVRTAGLTGPLCLPGALLAMMNKRVKLEKIMDDENKRKM